MTTLNAQVMFGMKPEQMIAYLEQQGYKITWDWHEQLDEAHAKAFTVAHCARIDILQDVHAALIDAAEKGHGERGFRKQLEPILKSKGWWGKQVVVDGEGNAQTIQLGSVRRLQTIYHTNTRSAYMAGRYQEMMGTVETHPYWQYDAIMDDRTRASHAAMNGKVFAADDPVWETMYPPNGWRCRCSVRAISRGALRREGLSVESSDGRLYDAEVGVGVDKSTGEVKAAQVRGIRLTGPDGKAVAFRPDAGFSGNCGKAWQTPFMPPPLDGLPGKPMKLPETWDRRQEKEPLPPVRPLVDAKLLPTGLTEEAYANRFLAEFGTTIGKPVVYTDKAGAPLVISEDLFKDKKGNWKILKNGRERYLMMLTEVIRDPDEIWMAWTPLKGQQPVLRRRYLRRLSVDGQAGIGVFEEGRDGWCGITLFNPDELGANRSGCRTVEEYLEVQRGGLLVYRSQK